LENTAGNLPIWLIPEQVAILSISDKYEKYTKKVLNLLEINEIRALLDDRSETMGRKIRDAEINKTPYMIIIGESEEKENCISLRKHGGDDLGKMSIEDFVKIINNSIKNIFNN
jgi:threonyl-tRNA synthetase